jgi:hypothetical protein
MSPFSKHGARLIQRGYSVIPIAPGTKYPGEFRHGEWSAMRDWPRYAERAPTKWEIPFWEQWPGAGIGVVFGVASGHLVGVDIDVDDQPVIDAIRAALPPTTVKKRGAKGATFFYRGPGIESKSFNDANGQRLCDLLGPGRQSLLPPSIHPGIESPYRWIGPDCLDYLAPSALPLLPPNAAELIGDALTPFGYMAEPEREVIASADVDSGDKSHFRQLNDLALANLDAWVPMLGLYRCRRTGRGYQAVATWRPSNSGQPSEKRKLNLHVTPEGINDFGGGPKKYSAIDLVMAAKESDWPTAFEFLSGAFGPGRFVTIALRARGK